jgi:branched-chain amino acid transport system ATP-binding protein
MLKLERVHAHYGKSHVLQGVNLEVGNGEAVALLGRNGVGKTTTLKTIMGLVAPSGGSILFGEARLEKTAPHLIPRLGVGYVPQGRRIFPTLTVLENLCLGLARDPVDGQLDPIFARFPVLKERLAQLGGTLSGGEQQMLAIARCLVMKPKLILLDEPTEGIMPKLVASLRADIKAINREGVSVLLVEQNLRTALLVCDRVYVMEKGVICHEGASAELRERPEIVHRFLGVALQGGGR